MPNITNKSIAAENTFSDAVQLNAGQKAAISLSGTFSATVTLQRNIDGANWRDVQNFSAATEQTYEADCGQQVRIGVKTGNYSSGTAVALLAKD